MEKPLDKHHKAGGMTRAGILGRGTPGSIVWEEEEVKSTQVPQASCSWQSIGYQLTPLPSPLPSVGATPGERRSRA